MAKNAQTHLCKSKYTLPFTTSITSSVQMRATTSTLPAASLPVTSPATLVLLAPALNRLSYWFSCYYKAHVHCSRFVIDLIHARTMPRGQELSVQLRNRIVAAYNSGDGYKRISAAFNVHVSTVRHIIAKYKQHGTTASLPRSGRLSKISARALRKLTQEVSQNPNATSGELQQMLNAAGLLPHRTTVRRALNRVGLRSCIPRKKPLLQQRHRDARLQFANAMLSKPDSYWQSVLWTDETKIELFGRNEKQCVWHKPNTSFEQKHLKPTVKHGGGSIMLWVCFAAAGTGRLMHITEKMNSAVYQQILDENLQSSVHDLGLGRAWTLQQDNDPKHTSAATRRWLQQRRIKVMEWPSQSPDLNPIEMLWTDLKKMVHARKPKNLWELAEFCIEEWQKVPAERCAALVNGYRKRLLAVVAARGGATKY
ncbi:hypothetical protein BOX15_Mlig033219g1 [Macrostomum lignano]|uniref:Paired domain-containing protein n=1 Tax=Macrostomum lignano TaxID=282301 RepID=A0A267DP74_9PLAT|nr:hypothetical protein BOX15_Mlig033219g1 [Macrostomum lignano]